MVLRAIDSGVSALTLRLCRGCGVALLVVFLFRLLLRLFLAFHLDHHHRRGLSRHRKRPLALRRGWRSPVMVRQNKESSSCSGHTGLASWAVRSIPRRSSEHLPNQNKKHTLDKQQPTTQVWPLVGLGPSSVVTLGLSSLQHEYGSLKFTQAEGLSSAGELLL